MISHGLLYLFTRFAVPQKVKDRWLPEAAMYGKAEKIETLLRAGADVNTRDSAGYTVLHRAAIQGHTGIALTLLRAGANSSAKDDWGRKPLQLAAEMEHSDTVSAMQCCMDNPEASIEFAAPNSVATVAPAITTQGTGTRVSPHADFRRLLPQRYKNFRLRKALYLYGATTEKTNRTMQRWIAAGATPCTKDRDGRTPLHIAVMHKKQDLAQILLEAEADLNARDKSGRTPLHLSIHTNYRISGKDANGKEILVEEIDPCFTLLLDYGANVNAQDKLGRAPLHETVVYARYQSSRLSTTFNTYFPEYTYISFPRVAKTLLTRGADVNARDNEGNTPLLWALRQKHHDIIPVLLDFGADPDLGDNKGITPRIWVRVNGLGELLTQHPPRRR